MLSALWLVPVLPFAGFAALALFGRRLSRTGATAVGVGSVGLSAAVSFAAAFAFLASPPPGIAYRQKLWTWMSVSGSDVGAGLYLDALSLVMMLVVTFVAFLIHLYSSEFMEDEEGYSRFFACMNLFVGAMLTLVLADNLLLLYLGWEGVGLCSYLLIGFWYRDGANGRAARKAFIVTRVGDAALAVGLFLLFADLGTLDIQEAMRTAAGRWAVGGTAAVAAAALLLTGALGKSAQLPLHTWLPDAMAGPTPVSALIHAATMVTAGVYLVARTHVLFELAPVVQAAVAGIGALTLLLGGFCALAQRDIKRVLAYSTMSQIGYMFLGLGVGAWTAALFHFMTHAFFKALLFLCAGAVIRALHHEHDIFRMGGLRTRLPVTFWTFLVAGASLSGLPLVTAGFYSKDAILWAAWSSEGGSPWLWAAGWAGAFLTGIYMFRVVFLVFFGDATQEVTGSPGNRIRVPLLVLAALSAGAGFLEIPRTLGHFAPFSAFLGTALPHAGAPNAGHGTEIVLQLLASGASLLGILLAYLLFLHSPERADRLLRLPAGDALRRLWLTGFGIDRAYDALFVRPFLRAAHVNRNDFVDIFPRSVAWTSRILCHLLRGTQTGEVRLYAKVLAAGSVLAAAVVLLS